MSNDPSARGLHRGRAAIILALVLAACKGDDGRETPAEAGGAVRPAIIAPQSRPYRERTDLPGGTVRVALTFEGDAPGDTAHEPPPAEQAACGGRVIEQRLAHDGDRLAEAVVWLPDVREGKPLPVERRHELTIERCVLQPRVQVAVAGGTLNLRALDDAAHRTRFVRQADGASLAEISTTEPISVVPDERVLREPGAVEVTCALHPWSHAWLLAFDHPYAAVSARDGVARLEGVPAGRWRVVVWHERFGVREDSVTVVPGGDSEVKVRMGKR